MTRSEPTVCGSPSVVSWEETTTGGSLSAAGHAGGRGGGHELVVIPREEQYLKRRFGRQYLEYSTSVVAGCSVS